MNNTTNQIQLKHGVEITVYLLTLIVGISGNILVLLVVIGRQHRRSINDLFIANLAISDLAHLLFFLPLKTHAKLFGDPGGSVVFCKFVYPMMTITFSVGILTLTSMALHRCYFIIHPFKVQPRHRTVLVWMLLIWVFAFGMALPLIIVVEVKDNMCYEMWSESSEKAYTVVLLILQCALPLIGISVAHARIAFDLLSKKTARAYLTQEGNITADKGWQENMQVVRTLIAIVVLFIICMFPLQIAWIVAYFAKVDQHTLGTLFIISGILGTLHACMNPIIYGTTKYFRQEYITYLSCCLFCCRHFLKKL